MSSLVAATIDDDDDEGREIPFTDVKDEVLKKVIEYCTYFTNEEAMTEIQLKSSVPSLKPSKLEEMVQPWYANFVKVEQSLLFELVSAAKSMAIKPLFDLTTRAVAELIQGKDVSTLRRMFNINHEFSP